MESLPDLFYGERYCAYRNVAALVGVLYLAKVILGALYICAGAFCTYVLAPLGISRTNIRKYGKWAVVTGASEGIGRGYALELARRGLDVVIMSRSREKLDKVAQEITSKYKEREVRVFPVDFSKGEEVYPDIAEELKDLDIGILVNNVGMSYEHPEFFASVPPERLHDIVEVNIQSMVQMTRMVLPLMESRRRGLIVNLSSGSQFQDFVMQTLYRSTKTFVGAFSDGLRKEYTSKGINVQNVTPCFVATKMTGSPKTNVFIPDGLTYACSAVGTIGIQKNTYGYWPHVLQGYLFWLTPASIMDKYIFKAMKQGRLKYLRRKARETKQQ